MTLDQDVTVIIPTAGRATVRRSVQAALGQSGVAVEVILADDSTSGDVRALADELGIGWVRVGGLGPCQARNTGVDAASASWVAFLDDDDAWCPHHLAASLSTASETGALLVTSATNVVLHDGSSRKLLAGFGWPLIPERLLTSNPAPTSSALVWREIAGTMFDEGAMPQEDWNAWLQLLDNDVPMAFNPWATVAYRKDVSDTTSYTVTAAQAPEMLEQFSHNYLRMCERWPCRDINVIHGRQVMRAAYLDWLKLLRAGERLPLDYYERQLAHMWGPPRSRRCCDPLSLLEREHFAASNSSSLKSHAG